MKLSRLILALAMLIFVLACAGTALSQRDANMGTRFSEILKDTDHPLTEAQLKQLKEMPQGRESFQKMMEILTEDQYALIRKSFRSRRGRRAPSPILLKGGHVIDPLNNINDNMDVLVDNGKIARVAKNIQAPEGAQVVDVSGLYVTPGLIDIHAHVFYTDKTRNYRWVIPDDKCIMSGVTTAVDPGSSGAYTFERFKDEVIDRARIRVLAFLNIVAPGMQAEYENDHTQFKVGLAVETAKKYPRTIIGFKTAHYRGGGYDELHGPWTIADSVIAAGNIAKLPVMLDFHPAPASDGYPERSFRDILLNKMRPGDIYTHCFARMFPVVLEDGKVNPDAIKAQQQGRIFDVGHGAGSFVFLRAVPAIKQGFYPNSISTDLHDGNSNSPVIDMSYVMSKFICMGMPLEDVIRCSTINPAREINRPELGHLSVGAVADIAVLDLLKGDFGYPDVGRAKITCDKRLQCAMTLFGGNIIFDLNAITMPNWEDIPKESSYWNPPSLAY
ncbi:amidohydrolase/deacetylase family metallohydrolase [Candidatus Latescibacterota bacterium]